MKNITLTAFISFAVLCSCIKDVQIDNNGWNAISFTEAESPLFENYMNLPYINLTFPALITRGAIDYNSGILKLNGFSYVFIGHNWSNDEIVVVVHKDGSKYYEKSLLPEHLSPEGGAVEIINFSFSFVTQPGEYTFSIYVKDERGLTLLKNHLLHDTKGKMLVL